MTFREDRFQELKVPLTWTGAAALAVAAAAALALLLGDRREVRLETAGPEAYRPAQAAFDAAAAPLGATLSAPVTWTGDAFAYVRGYFFAVSENRRLREKVIEGERWRQAAVALKDVNDRYAALLKLRTEPPIPTVGARVVTDVRGPYNNHRLADAGSAQGVRIGNPAMTDQGLMGRVVGVSARASRIMLLTDVASHTPVMVDRTNARAILTGDGGGSPRLAYIRGEEPVKAGDVVLTSGDGGVIPRGLPVGEAAKGLDGEWRVRLYSDRTALDFVRLLLFQDFAATIDEAALARSAMPPAPPLARPAMAAPATPTTVCALSIAPGTLMRPSLWRWLALPLLAALAATVLFATPLRVLGLRLPEPVWLAPLAFAWPLIRPSVAGPLALLAGGLLLDLFWGGAMGVWALALLAAYGVALFARPLLIGQGPVVLAAWYVGQVAVLFGATHLLTIFDLRQAPSAAAIGLQALATVLLYPLAYRLADAFEDAGARIR